MMTVLMQNEQVRVQADKTEMNGTLALPEDSSGVILIATCTTGNRVSPPTDYVASILRDAHLGTLWMSLLNDTEAGNRQLRFDVPLLTERLRSACHWLCQHEPTAELPLGLYGASSCAAAALQLAAAAGHGVSAIVSRGGCPELAGQDTLEKVAAPTLLIVGGLDNGAIRMHRSAFAALRCKKRLEVIPGATQTFEEAGNQEVVARLTRAWFLQHVHSRLR
jgi:putative phosphoribosyl transferase